ncbi:hypothetical protein B4Q13_24610, partial [Lacticaseibacillus rhamnosus]
MTGSHFGSLLAAFAGVGFSAAASAATINFGTAQTISGPTDVKTIDGKPIYGLTFPVQDFGTRATNYGPSNANVSGGEQTYTVDAFNGAVATDLSVADANAESLISMSDLGTSLKATSGVFDSQGAN